MAQYAKRSVKLYVYLVWHNFSMPDMPPMPPIDVVDFDDLTSAEQEAALDRLFGTSGVAMLGREVFLGLSDGDAELEIEI